MRLHPFRLGFAFPILSASLLLAACGRPDPAGGADLILRGGKIVTMDPSNPQAEALAVKDGRIAAVGSAAEIGRHQGESTRIIDLNGMLAVPGLIEGHGHFMRLGESLLQLDLRQARNWSEIVSMVSDAASRVPPGEWIIGHGWHQDKWEQPPQPSVEGLPRHEGLSRASPRHPVLLRHVSGHGVFVNALAMELSSISRATPDPEGGEIVRDSRGEPIGMLREDAAELALQALDRHEKDRPPQEREQLWRRQADLAAREAIVHGITSFQDMGSSFETIDFLKKLAEEGNLPVRMYMAIQEPAEKLEGRLADYRMVGYGDGFLTVRTIGEKVLDGALGTHGGWLLEPYSDLPRSVGFNVTPVEDIRRSAQLALEHDFQMAIQGIGDRAVRVLLDLYEEAWQGRTDTKDLRWRIEHVQVVHPDDLPRFAELGVIPSIQGIFACSDGPWVIDRLGPARSKERGYLFRSMVDSGAIVTNGADPPVEDIDPIASFHCSVTRELADGSRFFPEQGMTRRQALYAYTAGNAMAAFEEADKGTLSPGKLADITVLTKDILSVPEDEIRSAEVAYTIIGGQIRYRRTEVRND